ncbi:OsmC-related (seleno)protein [Nitratireductor kimnyeongensis]|uniref:OsmC-related (Seleno)protein n=1 Tax=Nitratireductor kimnyeongensis TaxID=430679 RepID=A0ABW0T7N6_9HYPH|nr:OsmC family protein [Nitratireductor kimnyeongensis]QZZ34389.1 OsmC family protein [Nitratireductor kimnyeongensis]
MADSLKKFDLIFTSHAVASGKMRNDIVVEWPDMKEKFELATDEGAMHGGDGTAPPPLALFSAALCGCIMTQIRAFAKRLKVEIRGVEVNARFHWSATQSGKDPYVSEPVSIDLDVNIESDATDDELRAVHAAARKGCFIEQTIAAGLPVNHRLKLSEDWVAA